MDSLRFVIQIAILALTNALHLPTVELLFEPETKQIIDLLFTIILSNYSNVAALGKLREKRVSSLIVGRTADIRKFNLEFNNPSLSLTECYRIFFQF